MIVDHFTKLRAIPVLANTRFLIAVESNYGGSTGCDQVQKVLERSGLKNFELIPRVTKIGSATSNKPALSGTTTDMEMEYGVWTDEKRKAAGVKRLLQSLARGSLCYFKEFVTQASTVEACKEQIHSQLDNYREEIREPADIFFGQVKRKYGGKGAGGLKDDIVTCIQLCSFLYDELIQDPKFIQRCQREGWTLPGQIIT